MTDLRTQLQAGLSGTYTLERELGRGGMATVFLAQDLKHDRPVALKVLHPELAASLGPERFQREIKLAARLQHPHILTVLDSGRGGRPALVHHAVRRGREPARPAPARAAAPGGRRAPDRARGRARRSTTPTSTASSTATSSPRTSCSPGTAARSSPTSASPARWAASDGLTQTGIAVGTPAYMSPEQAAGDQALDARTDLYSLAAVLYEMLAGEPPFTGATAQAMIGQAAHASRRRACGRCGRACRRRWTTRSGRRSRRSRRTGSPRLAQFAQALHGERFGADRRCDRADARGRARDHACASRRDSRPTPAACVSGGGRAHRRAPHRRRTAVRAGGMPAPAASRRAAGAWSRCSRSTTWATRRTPTSPTA